MLNQYKDFAEHSLYGVPKNKHNRKDGNWRWVATNSNNNVGRNVECRYKTLHKKLHLCL